MKKKFLLLNKEIKMDTSCNFTQTEPTIREGLNIETPILPRITSQNKLFETGKENFTFNTKLNKFNETPFQEYQKGINFLNDINLNSCETNNSRILPNNSEVVLNSSKKKAVLTKLFKNLPCKDDELRSTIVFHDDFKAQKFRHKRQSRNENYQELKKFESSKKNITQTINNINYPFQKKKIANNPTLLENEGIKSKLLEVHNYPLTFPDEDLFDKTRKGTKDFQLTQETQESSSENLKSSKIIKKKKIILPDQKFYSNFPVLPVSTKSYIIYSKKNLNYLTDRNSERRKKNQNEPNYSYRFHNKINDETMMLTNFNNYFKENNENLKHSTKILQKNESTLKINTSKLNEYIKKLNGMKSYKVCE
jgi:hypothetical protein